MTNGQTGLPLAAPPGGGSGINLDQVLPFLMLLSPLLEMRSPGSGLGLSTGILGYQQAQQKKRQGESMSLLQLLSEVDDDQLETAQGALIDAGYTPALVKAMAKASRGMVDPARKAERALNQLVEDPSLGLIPRRTQIDIQARRQTEEQAAGREDVRFRRQEATESQRFERGQVAGLAGEARSLLTSILLNPGASPQSRVQAQRLFNQLAQGADPQAILAEAQAIVGQVGEAGAAQGLRERQLAFRQRRVAELEAEVESAVPAAAGRIRRLAKEQGLDPAPYLQRLAQNIRENQLRLKALERQARGPEKDKGPDLTPAQRGQLWQEAYQRARDEVWGPGITGFLLRESDPEKAQTQMADIEQRAQGYFQESVRVSLGLPPGRQVAPPGTGAPKITGEVRNAILSDARSGVPWEGGRGVLAGLRAVGITDPAQIKAMKQLYDSAKKPKKPSGPARPSGAVAPSPAVPGVTVPIPPGFRGR